ncbi:unnamed protein product, partial [Symbiodinium necroappetens]
RRGIREARSLPLGKGDLGCRCDLLRRQRGCPLTGTSAVLSLQFDLPTATDVRSGFSFMQRPLPYLLLVPLVFVGLSLICWGNGAPDNHGQTAASPVSKLASTPAKG